MREGLLSQVIDRGVCYRIGNEDHLWDGLPHPRDVVFLGFLLIHGAFHPLGSCRR